MGGFIVGGALEKACECAGGGGRLGSEMLEDQIGGVSGIEPMFPLRVAVELIPMPTMAALYQFLHQHKLEFPAKYRRSGGQQVSRTGFSERLLTRSEILRIRDMTINGDVGMGHSKRHSGNRFLAGVMRRAMQDA